MELQPKAVIYTTYGPTGERPQHAPAAPQAPVKVQFDRCSCCHRGLFINGHSHPWDGTRG